MRSIMSDFILRAEGISKAFAKKKYLFKNIDFTLSSGETAGITGANGSGKSTFVKILAGLISPSEGKIRFDYMQNEIDLNKFNSYYGFAAPYLNLYDEFSPIEHIEIIRKIKNSSLEKEYFDSLINRFGLWAHRHKQIKQFSSGMKQRMKIINSLIGSPKILFLDEPTSNLDAAGSEIVGEIIREMSAKGCGIIIATNEDREKTLCSKLLAINE